MSRWSVIAALLVSAAFASCTSEPGSVSSTPSAVASATPTLVAVGSPLSTTCVDRPPTTAPVPASGDRDDSARALMTAWLTYFTTPAACPTSRVRKFTFELGPLRYRVTDGEHWIVPVVYSVLPAEGVDPLRWLVANGQLAPNGWVEGKSVFVWFHREADTLILEQMTTSPYVPTPTSTETPR